MKRRGVKPSILPASEFSVLPDYLDGRHARVAVIGAGNLGEFREEDQICCAWISAGLMRKGYIPENAETAELVSRWLDAPPVACLGNRSVVLETNRTEHRPGLHSGALTTCAQSSRLITERLRCPPEDSLTPIRMPADRDERSEEALVER
jgi:2-phosphosulfolactate phosphatase